MTIDRGQGLSELENSNKFLREAVGSLRSEWMPEDPPLTIILSRMAEAFVAELNQLSDSEVEQVLSVVEHLLIQGDDGLKDAVATGFLETLLREVSAGRQMDFSRIASRLGEQSVHYCKEWDAFTGCKTPGLE